MTAGMNKIKKRVQRMHTMANPVWSWTMIRCYHKAQGRYGGTGTVLFRLLASASYFMSN